MLPAQRRQELQQLAVHRLAGLDQPRWRVPYTVFHSTIAAVTVEAAGPVALLLEAPILISPRRLKNTARQRVARLTFVQAGMHAAAQFNTLQPVQMNSVLDPAQLAQATASPFWRG
ncbi:hypothetical protein ECZU29_59800 [Escherichia coli]|nr:hypothetical protein ECZU29_59800 [Escherichia coli]